MPELYCWACITGQCQNSVGHEKHTVDNPGMIPAITSTGGTPLCKDCAKWRANSQISI